VAEREASGDFDYLWDNPADGDGLTSDDQDFEVEQAEEIDQRLNDPGDDLLDEPDDNFWDNQPDVDDPGHFDAFNVNTWSFTPAPTPWYRTKQALTAITAASAAMAAIVVSGVLLVFRSPDAAVNEVPSSVTPTAPTSAAPLQVASSPAPEPPLPPPPPPETVASPVNPAPRYNPSYEPRPIKAPEIGVTRTPVTRQPISVAPQPRGPNQRR
jgi:hypothetical protein